VAFCDPQRRHRGDIKATYTLEVLNRRAVLTGHARDQEIEKIDGEPRVASTLQWRPDARDEAIAKIRAPLEKAGITFLPESALGVGLRGMNKR
jgi:hypothetical protein